MKFGQSTSPIAIIARQGITAVRFSRILPYPTACPAAIDQPHRVLQARPEGFWFNILYFQGGIAGGAPRQGVSKV